jgi:putative MFS transporter
MFISTIGSAACLYLFTASKNATGHLAASCVAQFLGNIMWGVLYSYTTEVYPTQIRTLGFAVASSLGRVGGAIAPLLAGILIEHQISLALYTSTGILLLASVCMIFLPIETRGQIVC